MFEHLRLLVAVAVLIGLRPAMACAQVEVTVRSTNGSSVAGRLDQLTDRQLFLRTEDDIKPVAVSDVLRISVLPRETPAQDLITPRPSATPWLATSTGDWLRVRPLMIDDESVVARWSQFPDQPPLTIPLEVCRGAILELPSDPYRQGIEFLSLFDDRQTADRVVLRNGDRVAGEFLGLEEDRLQLETPLGMTTAGFEQVRSLAFNPDLISTPELPDAHVRVVLRDGSLLRLKSALSNGGVLLGETLIEAPVSLPLEHIVAVWFFDASRIPVSSLPIEQTQVTPYLSIKRSPQADRNVLGGLARVRGVPVASGIGTSSGSVITFALEAVYSTLLGRVALDDTASDAGSVRFEIIGDSQRLWRSSIVTVEGGPVEIPRLDVSRVTKLTLKVHFADRGNVRDIANWCDLVLLK
ncbi:MAG: NPCBM/NEW2 domain-containing protein [Planctomycetota bacterium]|jgi:hypothetical protein